jgi:glucose dehydrogenase
MVAYDPETGRRLWHANLPALQSKTPITYMMDAKQYLVFAANDELLAYKLP